MDSYRHVDPRRSGFGDLIMAYETIPPSSSGSGTNVLDYNEWIADQEEFITGLIPQITNFGYMKIGELAFGGTSQANDGAIEGGGKTMQANVSTWFSSSIFQTCNTGKWAFAMRAKYAAPVAGRTAAVGLSNTAAAHDIIVGTRHSVSATNYVLLVDGTTSTEDDSGVARDANLHDFVVTGDGTNLKLYIDSTLRVTRAIGTNVVDEATFVFGFNTVGGDAIFSAFLYGYVAP